MASISSIGVGSGLDLSALLKDLRTSEEAALTTITTRQSRESSRLSAYGQLSNVIEKLQTAAKAFEGTTTFGQFTTTQTGESFTSSATSKAVAGTYKINVQSLASSQTLIAAGQADKAAQNGTGGDITFTLANGESKTVSLGNGTSLNDIAAAINADPELGINATIINDGDANTPFRLMFTTAETGTQAAISNISVINNDGDLGKLLDINNNNNMSEQAATDAQVEINGIVISNGSNTLEDVIEGVTLNLSKADGEVQTLTVSKDDSKAKSAIKSFVDAYNSAQAFIKTNTAYNEASGGSVLIGDSTTRTAQTRLRDILNIEADSGGVFSRLSEIGITTQIDGSLKIDDEKLDKALSSNRDDVAKLFQGTNGIASRTESITKALINSTDGIVTTARTGAQKIIDDLGEQLIRKQEQIDAKMEIYRIQFTKLDSLIAQMNSTSEYLTQQFAAMNSSSNNK
ncbi:Flagellar cap protein [Oligella ureolytica]|uniref:Flagellar hook-associated protein 2 n=1 Tax=Oligella ureolytica TaxID=90244 RepID=A0A378XGQ9_9BURK|nr:flagellar filament capping protein FliD [Oligella ureolytica]QPT39134.1 flagellar filament capping protein FliD [Oligella ureolytica]SUA54908.1 Flagellar cap protein [Oligella ureolytica]